MKVLDLFSGIGGFSLGLERAGMETVAFCEINPFCQKVLKKHWPGVYVHDDIKTLGYIHNENDCMLVDNEANHEIIRGSIDVICGGYPCQPFSNAGKRSGAEDDRHLWPEMYRIIKAVRPRWVIAENVAGHISMGLDDVLSDLETENYACWTFVIPACAVDAKHRRDRVWILAYAINSGLERHTGNEPDRNESRWEPTEQARSTAESGICNGEGAKWAIEPDVGRLVDGIPRELDLYRGLIDEQGDIEKTDAEALRAARWRLLRAMWQHRKIAASSPETYAERLHDCVPEMPYGNPHAGWNLGAWIEKSEGLRDLWEAFYSKPFEEAQNLQQSLLERIRKIERTKEVGPTKNRVDRIISLGNAVVPQIVEIIGKAIISVGNNNEELKQ